MNWTNGMMWQIKLDKKEYRTNIKQKLDKQNESDEEYDLADQVGQERISNESDKRYDLADQVGQERISNKDQVGEKRLSNNNKDAYD